MERRSKETAWNRVITRVEGKRGCGYRKPGGLYLVCDGFSKRCGRLPVPIEPCPHCEERGIICKIEQTRSWTWINARKLLALHDCQETPACITDDADGFREYKIICDCPLAEPPERAGLLWIGEAHYKAPADFLLETEMPHPDGRKMGVSKRIATVPKGFKLSETWVFVAHPKAIVEDCPKCEAVNSFSTAILNRCPQITAIASPICEVCKGEEVIYRPAIFHAFQPTGLEYIVTGEETNEDLDRLKARGITPVKVETEEQYYQGETT